MFVGTSYIGDYMNRQWDEQRAAATLTYGDFTQTFGNEMQTGIKGLTAEQFAAGHGLAEGDVNFLADIRSAIDSAGESGTLDITGDQIERLRNLGAGDEFLEAITPVTTAAVVETKSRSGADERALELARRRGRASTILTSGQGVRPSVRGVLGA